jgi:hypothetical protein
VLVRLTHLSSALAVLAEDYHETSDEFKAIAKLADIIDANVASGEMNLDDPIVEFC